MTERLSWDNYFLAICDQVASRSRCLSRQLGAVIVRDRAVLSTGYNGPARDVPHCLGSVCPRKKAGYESGSGLHLCPAVHAEANAVAQAARLGVSTAGATIYLNWIIPCKDCLGLIINAGIIEIVIKEPTTYGYLVGHILESGLITIRTPGDYV